MSLQIVGLNHKTAPLEIREKLAFDERSRDSDLKNLADGVNVREALIISTCNRVEILFEGDPTSAFPRITEFLAAEKELSPSLFTKHLYHFSDEQAIRHLFRVAASLDSMIVGEGQILGQVRDAYAIASKAGTVRRKIHKLLHHAFRAAKRVRSETRIGNSAVSVSAAAVVRARKIFGTLNNKTVLLVGAGEMAELTAKALVNTGTSRILVCNRTKSRAFELAQAVGGEVAEFEKLKNVLPEADLVVCSTSAPDFLISSEIVRQSQNIRQLRPALYIDISVPRNVSPAITEIENVFLYDVDDLQSVVEANAEIRRREISLAEKIVDEETAAFWEYLPIFDKGEALGLVRRNMSDMAQREFARQRARLGDLTPEQETAVEQLLRETINKIADPILYSLRRSHEVGSEDFAEILCTMLGGNDIQPKDKR